MVTNLSQHTRSHAAGTHGRVDTLFKEPLTDADAIIVGIAHNSFELNNDEQCGTTFNEATSTLSTGRR